MAEWHHPGPIGPGNLALLDSTLAQQTAFGAVWGAPCSENGGCLYDRPALPLDARWGHGEFVAPYARGGASEPAAV